MGPTNDQASCSFSDRVQHAKRARAQHAATRGRGRVGRSAAGRALKQQALELAVTASVRHQDTPYDDLLMRGVDRSEARELVRDAVNTILDAWRQAERAAARWTR